MLVNAHHRCVDHPYGRVMSRAQGVHDVLPDACPTPSDEPIVAGGPRAVTGRKIPPGCTRSQDPEYAIEHAPIIDTRHAARLVGKQSANDAPLTLRKLVSHDHTTEVGVQYLQRFRHQDGHVRSGVAIELTAVPRGDYLDRAAEFPWSALLPTTRTDMCSPCCLINMPLADVPRSGKPVEASPPDYRHRGSRLVRRDASSGMTRGLAGRRGIVEY